MARIFLVEDDSALRTLVRATVHDKHAIVAEATTRDGALMMVNCGALEKLEVDVAVIDANLKPDDYSCTDGPTITQALKEKYPNVYVISWSGFPAKYGNFNLAKPSRRADILNAIAASGK